MKKILAIINGNGAVGYFRSKQPHEYLQKYKFEDIQVDIINSTDLPLDDGIDYNYNIIHVHATLMDNVMLCQKLIEQRKKHNLKVIIDIDDYWILPKTNPAYKAYATLSQMIPKALSWCDGVTTTTKRFANEIRLYNNNICILPNCLDDDKITSVNRYDGKRKLRVGFIGGATHLEDLKLFKGVVNELLPYRDKLQFVLCGFDTKGTTNNMLSLWNEFEHIFTDDYKVLDEWYLRWLLQYNKDEWYDIDNEYYRRVWSKSIDDYHTLYDLVDVLIAPLVNDKFNSCKSELKIIEAGCCGKVIIPSKVGSYEDSFTDKEVMFVNNSRAAADFVKHIKYLLLNPSEYYHYASKLQDKIRQKFNIHKINQKRLDFYNNL